MSKDQKKTAECRCGRTKDEYSPLCPVCEQAMGVFSATSVQKLPKRETMEEYRKRRNVRR
jgi:hypothetical protein